MHSIIEAPADCPEFRRIFVDTFSDEPSFKYMLPEMSTRKERVAWLVDKKLKLFGDSYYTLATADRSGFAWWFRPGKKPSNSVMSQLKGGYWQAPFRFGVSSFLRMCAFGNQEGRILQKYIQEPYWILDVIAADPKHQRSGIGGALMQPIFEQSKKEKIPCFVLTHNARNVNFYLKYGFQLKIEEPVMGPGSPIAYGIERPF